MLVIPTIPIVTSPQDILRVLDSAAEDFALPMLDNGYVYLAATRMSLFRSTEDWAMVVEVFGFSPRAGLPDLSVWTFANRLHDRDPPEKYVTPEAYRRHLAQHPNDESRFFYPIAQGDWQDPECDELVAMDAAELTLRGRPVAVPSPDAYAEHGVVLSDPPRTCVFELCRCLAATHRDDVLATLSERRTNVPPELDQVLVLDSWNHPDLAGSARPSENETFIQLAQVLASGDTTKYRPTARANTHWSNWPDGGTL